MSLCAESGGGLFGYTLDGLAQVVKQADLPGFAAGQMARWLYKNHLRSISAMSNIPKPARELLETTYHVGTAPPVQEAVSLDGTRKYLFYIDGEKYVEAAYIPEAERATLCISTQVGCRRGCSFCATGLQGFRGDLSAGQILNQYETLPLRDRVTNIVYMGMGEPLDNLDAVLQSLEILTGEYGYGMSPRRITVSTVGIMPELRTLSERSDCNIAVSLHSPFPEERRSLMPVEGRHPISEAIEYLKTTPFRRSRRITFEYILLDGVNDTRRHAAELVRLLHGIRCRVNLIPYNHGPVAQFAPSPGAEAFREMLTDRGMIATVRTSRGQDIQAACGMLSTARRGAANTSQSC